LRRKARGASQSKRSTGAGSICPFALWLKSKTQM